MYISFVDRRAGKVKYQTPKVEHANPSHKYNGGSSTFRVQYHKQYPQSASVNNSNLVPYHANTFQTYNTEKGIHRWDYSITVQHENEVNNRRPKYRKARNHKKWHRNHRDEGFYQQREQTDIVN